VDLLASCAIIALALIIGYQTLSKDAAATSASIPIPSHLISFEGSAVAGSLGAKAAILEFSDFECPFCGRFASDILPALRERFLSTGQLLFAFRHFPLSIHKNAQVAAEAASCAHQQKRFGEFHDLLFLNRRQLGISNLNSYASAVGLDTSLFDSCVDSIGPRLVAADVALGRSLGVTGTPAFFIGTLEGQMMRVRETLRGSKPLDVFVATVERALAVGR